MISAVVVILVSLLFSAFFSGMEIAFVSADKLRFEMDRQKQTFSSSILEIFFNRPDKYISTILVGNNIALVVYGIQMAESLSPYLYIDNPALLALVQTLVSTLIVLVVGEFVPKMLFKINPNGWLNVFAVPLLLIYILLYPISSFMSWLSRSIMRLFGIHAQEDAAYNPSRLDLSYWLENSVEHGESREVENEVRIFQNALDFSKVRLRDCIVPRTEIVAVEYDTPLSELQEEFVQSGFSKILVYRDNIDNIIGYIHSMEMFRQPRKWQDRIILVPIVPETMPANKLMNILLLKKKSLAVVVDEFGGTAGMVTLEDIVEEIIGEIEDEHDTQDYVEKQLSDHEYVFSGRLEVDYVNDQYDLELPVNEDYMTIAGLILFYCQGFPKPGDETVVGNYKFKILKASQNKIELVKLIKV